MLTAYQTNTLQLLQSNAQPSALYPPASLTNWINIARGQLAGESESIRALGTLDMVVGQTQYNFSAISLAGYTGIQGVLAVRQAQVGVGTGLANLIYKPFPYFNYYFRGQVIPPIGQPSHWTQFGQGVNGTIFVYPTPDDTYTLTLDVVGYPIALADDTTVEAIPYQWTDAVSFFAAYYGFMSGQRNSDADRMMGQYEIFVRRARTQATPEVLPYAYSQSTDPFMANRLGISGPSGGGQG